MKFAIVILAIVAAASAQYNPFNNQYNPGQYNLGQYNPGQFNRNQQQYNPYNPFQNKYNSRFPTPAPYRPYVSSTPAPVASYSPSTIATPVPSKPQAVPVPKVANYDSDAQIVRYGNEIGPDSSYSYFYETSNGIAAQEQGTPRNFGGNPPVVPDVAQGSFAWTSPEGQVVAITYVADENGYQPSGDAIPTPPPVPALILKALDFIARSAPKK